MKDCLEKSGGSLNEVDAASVILKELWAKLRETHRLRVVKWGGLICVQRSLPLSYF